MLAYLDNDRQIISTNTYVTKEEVEDILSDDVVWLDMPSLDYTGLNAGAAYLFYLNDDMTIRREKIKVKFENNMDIQEDVKEQETKDDFDAKKEFASLQATMAVLAKEVAKNTLLNK